RDPLGRNKWAPASFLLGQGVIRMVMQVEPPSLQEGVGQDFFQESDGSDPWSALEDQAGRRRRLLEVTGVVWIAMTLLLAGVAIVGFPHRSRDSRTAASQAAAVEMQNRAN